MKRYFGEETPKEVMCEPVINRGMIFTADNGREYVFEQEGLNIWRSGFDGFLAKKAGEYGAEVRDGISALYCTQGDGIVKVTLCGEHKEKYTEEAGYVIDCEGALSAFKRTLIPAVPDNIVTFQTFNDGKIDLDCHYFYAYLQPELSEYDAWFNVKDNLLVLGTAVKDQKKTGFYYENFISYMKKNIICK